MSYLAFRPQCANPKQHESEDDEGWGVVVVSHDGGPFESQRCRDCAELEEQLAALAAVPRERRVA